MKRVLIILFALSLTVALFGCTTETKSTSSSAPSSSSYSSSSKNSSTSSSSSSYTQDDVKDWMKDKAKGSDYSYDDGGEYYCMGKNDTCTNKTHNALDLYCDSCDPNGDNIEG